MPLENALNGMPGLKTHALEVGARAVVGRADLRATATDLMAARQLVQERLSRVAAQLPAVAAPAGDPVAAVVDQPGA